MEEEKQVSLVVAGGDLRQLYCAAVFAKRGEAVTVLGFPKELLPKSMTYSEDWSLLSQADCLLLPLGISRQGCLNTMNAKSILLVDCLRQLKADCQVFGGNVSAEERQIAAEQGVVIQDYFREEELTVANAVLTAEGAISLALQLRQEALWGSHALILGGGRISRALLPRLLSFGVEVTVAARRPEQRIWAEAEGAKSVGLGNLSAVLPQQQLIFNTIPSPVLKKEELAAVTKDCLLLELASRPYGVDKEAAKERKLWLVEAAALPGKCSPKTAGERMAQTLLRMRRGG